MRLLLTCEISIGTPSPLGMLNNFQNSLDQYFQARMYGESIKTVYASFICVSAEFEPLLPVRKPRLLRKEPALEFDYKLDFTTYLSMDDTERLRYIATSYYSRINDVLTIKKIKDFNRGAFLSDLKDYLLHYELLNG